MKLLRLLIFSAFILYFAFMLQNLFDGGQWTAADASPARNSGDAELDKAYRKPDYEVTLTSTTEHVISGTPLTLTVQNSWYEAGATLDDGDAHEQLHHVQYTDAEGGFTIVLPVRVIKDHERQTWNIALPAQAYLMYAPEVWERSAGDQIVFEGKR